MELIMKIGVLRETKFPPDMRVPLTPEQCRNLIDTYPGTEIYVQPSGIRCYRDEEYAKMGIPLQEDLEDCDLLVGVKEVDKSTLIAGKKYMFFSHTAKEQPYNRDLLQEISKKEITLIDYEYLTRVDYSRVVAFGRWAGIVGAYNGLKAWGERTGKFVLPQAQRLSGHMEMKQKVAGLPVGNLRIAITGGGRVATGAMEILQAAGIREVTPEHYLLMTDKKAVFSRLDPWNYTRHAEGRQFEFSHFVSHPDEYENNFLPYAKRSDLYIACHFWDPEAPVLLSREDLAESEMAIKVIADISCDIDGPIASTIKASTIETPVYGYDPISGKEADDPCDENAITVMAVDNLPGEVPRDASADFGHALLENVIPSLIGNDTEGIIKRATITKNGKLTETFSYLQDYLEGKG